MGWVSLAMETVIKVLFPDLTLFGRTSFTLLGMEFSIALLVVSALVLMVALYALLSGLWGIVVTDAFQFTIAMAGSILMAIFVLRDPSIGGIAGLQAQLPAETFRLLPTFGEAAGGAATMALTIPAFIAFIGIQWWSSWYPGAEPGGGGYVAPAHDEHQERKGVPPFHALLYHCPLLPAPVALDPGRAILARAVPGPGRHSRGLCTRNAGRTACRAPRSYGGGIPGRVHEHHLHAAKLGRLLSCQRRVAPLRAAGPQRALLREDFASLYVRGRRARHYRDYAARYHPRGLGAYSDSLRRAGACAGASLVLVASECLERTYGHDGAHGHGCAGTCRRTYTRARCAIPRAICSR